MNSTTYPLFFNRTWLVIAAVLCLCFAMPQKAKAIDPITMAILAPVALKVAEAAKPYVIRSVVSTGKGIFMVGKSAFEILYLPLGICEATVGLPFNQGRKGVKHMIRGGVIAPAKVLVNVLLLPVYMTGARINI